MLIIISLHSLLFLANAHRWRGASSNRRNHNGGFRNRNAQETAEIQQGRSAGSQIANWHRSRTGRCGSDWRKQAAV